MSSYNKSSRCVDDHLSGVVRAALDAVDTKIHAWTPAALRAFDGECADPIAVVLI